MGLNLHGIALVKAVKLAQQLRSVLCILSFGQDRFGETGALHLQQLVDQHIARGANVARKSQAAAQQKGLAEGASVGELGEVQHHAGDVAQIVLARIGIVGKVQGVCIGFA
jgi:hypothetical protein